MFAVFFLTIRFHQILHTGPSKVNTELTVSLIVASKSQTDLLSRSRKRGGTCKGLNTDIKFCSCNFPSNANIQKTQTKLKNQHAKHDFTA